MLKQCPCGASAGKPHLSAICFDEPGLSFLVPRTGADFCVWGGYRDGGGEANGVWRWGFFVAGVVGRVGGDKPRKAGANTQIVFGG